MKRFFALVMSIVLALGLMAGCGGDSDNSGGTASGEADNGIFSTEKVEFIAADGSSVYRIIRPDGNEVATQVAAIVFKNVKDSLGLKVKNVLDTEDGNDQYEILVGNTNRPESQQALDYIYNNGYGRNEDYIICTIGKKIVINGFTDDAVMLAATYFVNNYLKVEGIEGGILYTYATEGEFKDITISGVNIREFCFVRDITSRSWLVQEEIRKTQEYIQDVTGYYVVLNEDTETEASDYEISVGNTNRAAKKQSEYGYEDWEIIVADKKVDILGGSMYSVQVAVTEFCNMLKKGAITSADSTSGSYSTTVAGYDSGTYYSLKWQEEFDYENGLDLTKWRELLLGNKGDAVTQVIDETTSSIENGVLIMRGFKDENGHYTHCPSIQADKWFRFNRGYIEMRARIPDGKGVYSSFWLRGRNGPDGNRLEVDIFESLGMAKTLRANIHKWATVTDGGHTSLDNGVVAKNEREFVVSNGTLFDQFRTISCLWNDNKMMFFCDGECYLERDLDEYFYDKWQHVIAGFNIGWADRTEPDATLFENGKMVEYHIDYFRLFQIDGQGIEFYQ